LKLIIDNAIPFIKGEAEKLGETVYKCGADITATDVRDADVLIYNATVEAPLKDRAELKAKDELFADFKAVQAGEVYQLGGDMYQSADAVAGLTLDFYRVLHGETDVPLQYLRKLS